MTTVLVAAVVSLAIFWLGLVLALMIWRPKASVREAAGLLPDLLRMMGSIARDGTLPFSLRLRLWLLLVYLAVPFDIVPDVIPVVGYADDVILVVWVIRSVVQRAGHETLRRHWPGTEDGLAIIMRLAGVGPGSAE